MLSARARAREGARASVQTHTHTHARTRTHARTHARAHTHAHTRTRTRERGARTHARAHTVRACRHTHARTHAHAHARPQARTIRNRLGRGLRTGTARRRGGEPPGPGPRRCTACMRVNSTHDPHPSPLRLPHQNRQRSSVPSAPPAKSPTHSSAPSTPSAHPTPSPHSAQSPSLLRHQIVPHQAGQGSGRQPAAAGPARAKARGPRRGPSTFGGGGM